MDWQNFGKRLQGMGEGFAGRGAQWQAAQARTKEAEAFAQRQASADESAAANLRQAEGFSNAQYTYGQIQRMREQNDIDGIRQVMPDHLRSLKMMGGNPAGLGQLVDVMRDSELRGIDNYLQDMAPIMVREQDGAKAQQMGETGRIVQTGDGSYARSVPVFNPSTGKVEEQLLPLGGTPVNDLGLTPTGMIDYSGEKTRASEGAKNAVGLSTQFTEQASKVRVMLPKYDELIALIDSGAQSGPIMSMLPSLNQASIELDALQKDLGIAVINSATFGALNKEELNLALSTAIPTKLRGPDLRAWAIKKKEAQSKLVDYLDWSSGVLGESGMTPSQFSRMVRSGQLQPPTLGSQQAPKESMQGDIPSAPNGVSGQQGMGQIKILGVR